MLMYMYARRFSNQVYESLGVIEIFSWILLPNYEEHVWCYWSSSVWDISKDLCFFACLYVIKKNELNYNQDICKKDQLCHVNILKFNFELSLSLAEELPCVRKILALKNNIDTFQIYCKWH